MNLTKRNFALLGCIIYFTFIGGTFYSQLNFLVRVANQIIVTGILGAWLLIKLRRKESLPCTHLDLAIVLYLAVNFLSALLGQSPRFSLEVLWFSVVHVLAFYLLVDLMRQGWTQRLTWTFYMASAVVCLVSLTEFVAWYVGIPLLPNFAQGWLELGGWQHPLPPQIHRVAIAMSGPTPLSAYLALLIPPAIGLIITLPSRNENRQALIIWLILAFLVQALTFSRSGVLALSTSLFFTAVGFCRIFSQKVSRIPTFWRRLTILRRMVIFLGGAIVVGGIFFWLQQSFMGRASSTNFRLVLWNAAINIFQNHLLTGVGPANFPRALLYMNEASLPRIQIATAHSIYLNTAAELGILGLFAGGYLFLVVGRAWQWRWQQTCDSSERIRLVACGAALAGLAVQTIVDTYTATPNMLIMLALVAYIVSDLKTTVTFNQSLRTVYIGLTILLIYLLGFAWITWADVHFQNSFRQERAGNLTEAVAEASQAYTLDPYLTLRIFRLALLEARLADQTGNRNSMQSAIEHYRLGLQQEPILGLNSANLAGLLWQQGRRTEAIDILQRTIAAEANPLYLINLGYFYEQQGNWAKAIDIYGQSLQLSPDLAASGFWQASPERAEKWPDFVDAATKHLSSHQESLQKSLRIRLALAQEDFDSVEALLKPVTPVTRDKEFRTFLVELYLYRDQPEQASNLLDPVPQDAVDYVLSGRVNLQLANYATAEKLLKMAIFLNHQEAYYYLGQLYEQKNELLAAEKAYQRGFLPRATPESIEVTIYGRLGANDLAPQLMRIGASRRQVKSWLALARLYEKQHRFEEAKYVYELLLIEAPFLDIAQDRLNLLTGESPP